MILHVSIVNPAFEDLQENEVQKKASDTGNRFSLFDSRLTTCLSWRRKSSAVQWDSVNSWVMEGRSISSNAVCPPAGLETGITSCLVNAACYFERFLLMPLPFRLQNMSWFSKPRFLQPQTFIKRLRVKLAQVFPQNLMLLRLTIPVKEEQCFHLLNVAASLSVPRIPPHNTTAV